MQNAGFFKLSVIWFGVALAPVPAARAEDVYRMVLKDHTFSPATIDVPANARFRIEVENQDATPAEFESSALKVEKIVVGGGKISVFAGPLKPGSYKFFDDYHPDQAKGTVIAAQR